MNLLGAVLYDPAVAVSKVTTALLAMTALDTTNLRLTFTVPLSGRVRARLYGQVHGAATYPTILLGVLNGATVVCRKAPRQTLGATATATAMLDVEIDVIVTGLTPGASLTWDAAYGVETLIAATGIKYGGPNDATGDNAFGGFGFEVWDPNPIYLPGVMPTATVAAQETTIAGKVAGLTFTTANKVDSTIQAAADLVQAAADKVWATAARTLSAGAITTSSYAVGAIDNTVISASENNAIADALFDRVNSVETGLTFRQFLRLAASALFGKASGLDVNAPVYRQAIADTKARITATTDANGNRSAITTDST